MSEPNQLTFSLYVKHECKTWTVLGKAGVKPMMVFSHHHRPNRRWSAGGGSRPQGLTPSQPTRVKSHAATGIHKDRQRCLDVTRVCTAKPAAHELHHTITDASIGQRGGSTTTEADAAVVAHVNMRAM